MIDFKDVEVGKESFSKLPDRIKYNYCIAEYYDELADDNVKINSNEETLRNIAERMRSCSTIWDCDWYRLQNTKSIVKTNRCRDKFCVNCQSALALAREHKFTPILNDLSQTNSIYHCIFTVSNCKGSLLKLNIKTMYTSFGYFVRYLSSRKKIKGLSFGKFEYVGAIKSLEVTYNEKDRTYHPHLHCLFCFSSSLNLEKNLVNQFSYSKNSSDIRYFSEEEILFQKIWYLLVNGQLHKTKNSKGKLETPKEYRVTKENIDNLDLGYSVVCNKADKSDYKEVFKYAFKSNFDSDKCLGRDQFRLYRSALKNIRFIQPYGKLIKYDFSDDVLSAEDLDIAYEEYKCQLDEIESPMRVYESYQELLDNMKQGKYLYITSGSIKSFILQDDESRLTAESKDILAKFKDSIG